MMLFQRTSVPKKLNISEVWGLYRTLQYGLKSDQQAYLIDEIFNVMDGISVEEFKSALKTFYPSKSLDENPVTLSLLFTKGMKINNVFSFSDFVKVLSGRTKR